MKKKIVVLCCASVFVMLPVSGCSGQQTHRNEVGAVLEL